jgi:hypothetical protein
MHRHLSAQDPLTCYTQTLKVLQRGVTVLRELHHSRSSLQVTDEALSTLAQLCDGDARVALNALEMSVVGAPLDATSVGATDIADAFQRSSFHYDKGVSLCVCVTSHVCPRWRSALQYYLSATQIYSRIGCECSAILGSEDARRWRGSNVYCTEIDEMCRGGYRDRRSTGKILFYYYY